MASITHVVGIAGAATASGATVVIDTFRAFTTAAVLIDRGVASITLADDVEDARRMAAATGSLLVGEVDGVQPPGFDLGNSPAAASVHEGLAGRSVVLRTSAGTRATIAALGAGATPVFAASLVVASATAAVTRGHADVTIVAAGLGGVESAEEDERTAALIADRLEGRGDPAATAAAVRVCPRAVTLASVPWSSPGDVAIACDVDRFTFAMEAVPGPDRLIRLVARTPASDGV